MLTTFGGKLRCLGFLRVGRGSKFKTLYRHSMWKLSNYDLKNKSTFPSRVDENSPPFLSQWQNLELKPWKKNFFLNAFLSFNESLIGMTDKFSHYFGVFVFVFSLTNVVRTVQAFSLYLGPKLYFNLNQISTYFVNKFLVIIILAEPSRAQRSTMRKNVSWIGILHFKYPRVRR